MNTNTVQDIYTLSPMQEGMLFHLLARPDSEAYFEQVSCELKGQLQVAAFRQAWQKMVDNYAVFRTSFHWDGLDKPVQVVHRTAVLPWTMLSWKGEDTATVDRLFEQLVQDDRRRGFQHDQAPLMRCILVETAEDTWKFIWSHHHILMDGWCSGLILEELFTAYEALVNGRQPAARITPPFKNYISWLAKQDTQKAAAFWNQELEGFHTPTPLGIGDAAAIDKADVAHGYAESRYQFSTALASRITEWTKCTGITMNTLMQGAWSVILGAYSGEEEVVFGATVSGRPPELAQVEQMVGLFINTLPVKVSLAEDKDVLSWLKALQERNYDRNTLAYSPLSDIKKSSGVPGDMLLFRSLLIFENYPFDLSGRQRLHGLEIGNVHSFEETNYPLTLMVIPRDGGLHFQINYFKDSFAQQEIENIFHHLEIVVGVMLDNGALRPAAVSLTSEAAREQVLYRFNNTETSLPAGVTVAQLIAAQVKANPDAVALICGEVAVSYSTLNSRAEQLKATLITHGVQKGSRVAVLQEKGIDLIVSLLAVMNTGAAFLPIDTALPEERITTLIKDAGVAAVLATDHICVPALTGITTVINPADTDTDVYTYDAAAYVPDATDTAYIIYTSGSTGRPKGVEISHLSFVNYILWAGDYYFPNAVQGGNFPLFTSPAFDLTLSSIFIPLSRGKSISIYEARETGWILESIFSENSITDTVKLTPSHITLLKELPAGKTAVTTLIVGGEALRDEHLAIIEEKWPGITVYNEYGPTEATVGCTARAVRSGQIDAGAPVWNTAIYILDKHLQPVPVGVKGEIFISGLCLAKGYIGQPEQTALRFIASPFIPEQTMYKTGDTGCWLENGCIQYFGRQDDQVKIRGHRIEPCEIEHQLLRFNGVLDAQVLPLVNPNGDTVLAAFIKAAQPAGFPLAQLQTWMAGVLPQYMLPATWQVLEHFPLTPNGKTDKKALARRADAAVQTGRAYRAPVNPVQEILAAVWADILKVKQPGIDDNFFDLGGHSLNATQITSRIRKLFKVSAGVKDIMENQTIEQLSALITALRQNNSQEAVPSVVSVDRKERMPLSFAQQGLWFLARMDKASAAYNIPEAIKLKGVLNISALQDAFTEITRRHEILRTNFSDTDGIPCQLIRVPRTFTIPVISLGSQPALPEKEIAAEAMLPFDLENDSLIRAVLFSISGEEHVLCVTMHHIISDGWSSGVLIRELMALYEAFSQGNASPLLPLSVQYADYAVWQRQLKEKGIFDTQLAYWKNKLADAPFILDLPYDKPRPALVTHHGNTLEFTLSPELSEQLRALSNHNGATLFMTLLSTYALLLSRYSGQKELLIGSSIANRNRLETESLIGFFINVIVYRINLDEAGSFLSLLEQVKQLAFEAYDHQELPFDQLIEEIQPERDASYSPVFQVAFDMQNMPVPAMKLAGLDITPAHIKKPVAKYDLSLSMEDTAGGIKGSFEYNTDLFLSTTAAQMVRHFTVLLESIAGNPKQLLSKVTLLQGEEYRKVVYDWNKTEVPLPATETVLDIVQGIAEEQPDRIAFEYDGYTQSYSQLEAAAERMAQYLLSRGMQKQERIAVLATRSSHILSIILGIMKAGGVYLPVDPEYPLQRIQYMLDDADVRFVIGTGDLLQQLRAAVIDYEAQKIFSGAAPEAQPALSPVTQEDLAYIIYTSGSTGTPKGVMIPHRGLLNLALEQAKAFQVNSNSRTLQFASLSFDASISEMFVSLCAASTLVMAPKAKMLPGADLINLLAAAHISHVTIPPSILDVLPYQALPELSTLIVAGEACSRKTADTWSKGRQFVNAYGPTEYSVCATIAPVLAETGVPDIGCPIGNTVAYILDEYGNPLPPGVPGELYIGGAGIGNGYVNLPELTAQRFVADPFSAQSNARMYRTGDLARYLPNGHIIFMGRIDRQVKLRGFRIEPGEIEAVLNQHPFVQQAVLQVQKEDNGHQRLVAFVTMRDTGTGADTAYEWQQGPLELWPSVAEFYVYDEFLYYAMTHDERRNEAYKKAIAAAVPGKVVVEIGTGKDAILSRFCVEAGAAKVYAVELNANTAALAREAVERAGYSDRITIVHGDATLVELPEPGDVCVSEIVGAIGGSEGAAVIINNSRRLLKPGGKMIPERSNTLMAAVTLPQEIHENPCFNSVPGHYTEAIFEQVGYPFDLRVCVKKFPHSHVLSTRDSFEDLDYTQPIAPETSHPFRMEIEQDGRMDGILVWLTLQTMPGVVIDILEHEYCWLPVFLPVFYPGVEVAKGDYITGICTRTLCENQLNPDFLLEGKLVKQDGSEISFSYHSWHYKQQYRNGQFYQKLFAAHPAGLAPQSKEQLRSSVDTFLQNRLPAYLLPHAVFVADSIPLTLNGKIDTKALLKYTQQAQSTADEYTAPVTPYEKTLAAIWQEVLGVSNIGVHHNFFKSGGDSILSIQVVSRARAAGIDFTPRELFENQTIAALAAIARGRTAGVQELVTGPTPLSPIQHWFFEQQFARPDHFNQAVLLEGPVAVDVAALRLAAEKLALHHDILRARFSFNEATGTWLQELMPEAGKQMVECFDLSHAAADEKEALYLETANTLQASMNLQEGLVFKVALFTMGATQPSRLLLIAHHLIVDGVSWRILLEDFFCLLARPETTQLPGKSQSFKQWTEALQAYAANDISQQEITYWKKVAQTQVALLPTDKVAALSAADNGGAQVYTLEMEKAQTSDLLQTTTAAYRAQMPEILLTAFLLSVQEWTGNAATLIELEGHGREDLVEPVDISRTAGWFTSNYPALFTLPGGDGYRNAVQAVKEQYRGIPGKGIGYGILKYLSAHLKGSPVVQPQIVFNYLGQSDTVLTADKDWRFSDGDCGFEQSTDNHPTHLLMVNIIVAKGQLRIGITYNKQIHEEATIATLAQRFAAKLRLITAEGQRDGEGCFTPVDFPMARLHAEDMQTLCRHIQQAGRSLQQVNDIYHLSPLQHGLLFQSLLDTDSVAYREQLSVVLRGELNVTAFKKAWQWVTGRYDILRTAFFEEGLDAPVQVVYSTPEISWQENTFACRQEGGYETVIEQFLKEDIQRPFAFTDAPLMRFTLNKLAGNDWFFCWTHHHILMDGWCLPVILREVFDYYESQQSGTALQLLPAKPYADFIKWLDKQQEQVSRKWWSAYLEGFNHPTPLGIEQYSGGRAAKEMNHSEITVPAVLEQELKQIAQNEGVTLNVLIQAAWSLLLSRYADTQDVVFGATVSGRPPELDGVEKMVGLFINSVPVRVRVQNSGKLRDWLQEIQWKQLERDAHSYLSLTKIKECSGIENHLSLFESLIIFENYPVDKSVDSGMIGIDALHVQFSEQTHYPITLMVVPAEELTFKISYDRQVFAADGIARMLKHLKTLLAQFAAGIDAPLSDLSFIDAAERCLVLESFNASAPVLQEAPLVPSAFARCVQSTPDAAALLFNGQVYNYAQLEEKACRLAQLLISKGVTSGTLAGVCMDRSADMLISLLAVHKAGAAYLPLDPAFPAERLQYMLQDAAVRLLITEHKYTAMLNTATVALLYREDMEAALLNITEQEALPVIQPEDIAYVIYTSGSTGRPKGVQISHGALANFIASMKLQPGIQSQDVLLAVTTISFDIAGLELFLPLTAGATLALLPDEAAADPDSLTAAIAATHPTVMQATPSTWQMLLDNGWKGAAGLKVLCGGEALPEAVAVQLCSCTQSVWNMYGPTETTIWSAALQIDPQKHLGVNGYALVGNPVANTRLYVLDQYQKPVAVGIPGELYIGGSGLAAGYLGMPELTQQRFVPDNLGGKAGDRMYRTGDLVKWTEHGALVFLGRVDQQVKIRGFRIETGEVETVLKETGAVSAAVVVAGKDHQQHPCLLAFVIPHKGDVIQPAALRELLKNRLPAYMIPSAFISTDKFPLTPNGKTDRRVLAESYNGYEAAQDEAYLPPVNSTQQKVHDIWTAVLGITQMAIRDNFFASGGHSLLATQCISRVRKVFNTEVPLKTIFDYPDIESFSAWLATSLQDREAQMIANDDHELLEF